MALRGCIPRGCKPIILALVVNSSNPNLATTLSQRQNDECSNLGPMLRLTRNELCDRDRSRKQPPVGLAIFSLGYRQVMCLPTSSIRGG
eukprot:1178182-Prorocentrum_minimum.AAC.2